MDRLLLRVDVADVLGDAALVVPRLAPVLAALVDQRQAQAGREERHLAHALGERRVVVRALVEDLEVGQERDARAGAALVGAGGRQRAQRLAARVVLLVDLAVAPAHRHVQPLRERVDHADADAVQAAGDLVHVAAELAAGVQLRQHDLDARQPRPGDQVDRDAAAVVRARHRAVGVQRHDHVVATPGERLVDRVVEHLVDEVVQARARRWSRCTCRVDGGLPRVPRGS